MTNNDLTSPYSISPEQIVFFRENGFIQLKQVLSPETLEDYGAEVTRQVIELNTETLPLEQRNTYRKAFLQVMNIWEKSTLVKEFVFSHRLGKIAADLLETRGVRLYHDQALYKEPGGGITPWHADQYYWPLASDRTVTAWIPFQPTPVEMGALSFCAGSHKVDFGRHLSITDESEKLIQAEVEKSGFPVFQQPFDLGDVSFHLGWIFHRAGPNLTNQPRSVMTIIYMDSEMLLSEPKNSNQRRDWERWCPGAQPGKVIDTPLNPELWLR